MITLGMDTSYKYLILVLLKDGEVMDSYVAEAFKKQSEEVFVRLIELMNRNNLTPDDLDEIIITKGPGSYTGIRIAMTIAKVFCTQKNKVLKTISTFQLYSGLDDTSVILDARSKRVYYGVCENGNVKESCIKNLDELSDGESYIGDLHLLDQEDSTIDFAQNFAAVYPLAEKVDNIHSLVPEYLKSSEAYLS